MSVHACLFAIHTLQGKAGVLYPGEIKSKCFRNKAKLFFGRQGGWYRQQYH